MKAEEGAEIKRARRTRKLTQRELAAAVGTSLRTITRLETGDSGEDPRTLEAVQQYLRVGQYTPTTGRSDDPPLSEATFAELVQALTTRHGQDVRAALGVGTTIHAIDELPPDVLRRAQDGTIPSGRLHPNEGNSGE